MFDSDSEPEVTKTVVGFYDEEDATSDVDNDVTAALPAPPSQQPVESETPKGESAPKRDDSKVKNALAGMLAGEMNKKLGIAPKKRSQWRRRANPYL